MEQLLLVPSCDSPVGIGASLRTHGLTNGWTHGRDVGNSILDVCMQLNEYFKAKRAKNINCEHYILIKRFLILYLQYHFVMVSYILSNNLISSSFTI